MNIDTILAFYGYIPFFFIPIFTAWLDVRARLFGHRLFWVSHTHMFCILVFTLVQHN